MLQGVRGQALWGMASSSCSSCQLKISQHFYYFAFNIYAASAWRTLSSHSLTVFLPFSLSVAGMHQTQRSQLQLGDLAQSLTRPGPACWAAE